MQHLITATASLGQLARAARMTQKLTRDELARATGLSPAFISAVERGKETAQIGKVLLLLRELGVTLFGEASGVQQLMADKDGLVNRRVRK
ncbi:helix-turn-helix domain-containing protein [Cupriavidus basilensis]|uniref:helix-turn-helix domain-containing protein n=1 Tax=Cupriavidus basilensis TaxID=68895 RepID=UPI00157B28F1|nr:helix-turn-helix transcriptional regulator [Cupriavidus basilensis]NUA29561.1 helix-turn-helix domain-containing protein [Cupriavidus basilensis]